MTKIIVNPLLKYDGEPWSLDSPEIPPMRATIITPLGHKRIVLDRAWNPDGSVTLEVATEGGYHDKGQGK